MDGEIEELKDELQDLKSAISHYGARRISNLLVGKRFASVCPWCLGDKEPTEQWNEAYDIFHCFSCGEGGNLIKWTSRVLEVDFIGAVRALQIAMKAFNLHEKQTPNV